MKCGHGRPGSALSRRNLHYLGAPFTISAYPSLSESNLDNKNKCGHDNRSWHYLGLPFRKNKNGITFVKLTFCEVELVKFRPLWALSEMKLAHKLTNRALSKVDLEQTLTKWTLSGTQIKRSGRRRGQN